MVTRAIRSAQTQVEEQNFEIRKNVLKYDEVLNQQRTVIYDERRQVLEGEDLHEQIRHMVDDTVEATSTAATAEGYPEDWDLDQLWTALRHALPGRAHGRRGRRGGRRRRATGLTAEFLVERAARGRAGGVRPARGGARRRGHARARAPRRALRARPQVARAPLRDGLPAGGHRPARDGPARPAGRVPARGLRPVPGDDGRASRRSRSATCSTSRSRSTTATRRRADAGRRTAATPVPTGSGPTRRWCRRRSPDSEPEPVAASRASCPAREGARRDAAAARGVLGTEPGR